MLRRETGAVRAALAWEPRTCLSACTLVILRLSDPPLPRGRFTLSVLRSSLGDLFLRSAGANKSLAKTR